VKTLWAYRFVTLFVRHAFLSMRWAWD